MRDEIQRGWRLEEGGWRLEVGGGRSEVGGWRLVIGGLEVGGWRLEVGGWRLEDGVAATGVRRSPLCRAFPIDSFHRIRNETRKSRWKCVLCVYKVCGGTDDIDRVTSARLP